MSQTPPIRNFDEEIRAHLAAGPNFQVSPVEPPTGTAIAYSSDRTVSAEVDRRTGAIASIVITAAQDPAKVEQGIVEAVNLAIDQASGAGGTSLEDAMSERVAQLDAVMERMSERMDKIHERLDAINANLKA